MEIRVAAEQPWDVDADVLAFPVPQDGAGEAVLSELDRRLDGALGDYRRVGELTGKAHGAALLRGRETAAPWLLGVGIGESSSFDALAALRFGAAVERRLGGRVCERLAIWLPAELLNGARAGAANGGGADDLAELIARGAVEGQHEPGSIYRDSVEGAPPQLRELIVVAPDGATDGLRAAVQRGVIIGEGGNRARRLAQRASNDVSPEVLADEATAVAREFGLQVEVIGPERATEMGMNLFMAVGRGSSNAPRFIVLRSGDQAPKDGGGRLLAMVGKGVTFDSGGISIKPADRMEEMKMDKTGACTVISAIATVATLAPGTPLMAVAPAVENLPGPHSTRPGDVVRALNGKVVEIQNTDAEGRLILA
ncbi:MAG: leucyl aminopeptidase family protein, partial [Candidatus Limnocylindrales bacterium]